MWHIHLLMIIISLKCNSVIQYILIHGYGLISIEIFYWGFATSAPTTSTPSTSVLPFLLEGTLRCIAETLRGFTKTFEFLKKKNISVPTTLTHWVLPYKFVYFFPQKYHCFVSLGAVMYCFWKETKYMYQKRPK